MKSVSRRLKVNSSIHGTLRASKGLAIVEEHIRRHDDAMINDCDEDINALLILGGLFSTILTAFISVSLGWFDEDYTQTTAQLLQQISVQLADDAARSVVAEPSSFEVASVDVAINILWFLSLVLCLAASLFGMIVKQWLREYSMWETEPAQDAIWLRQIRYKAFLQWKVPLIVALLPGLLELALVLFMVGIVAMLWTLNSVLAIVISVVSAFFAVIAFTMVIVPAFFPHCPYRSPVGWACVILWDAFVRVFFRFLWLAGRCSRPTLRDNLNRHRDLEDWNKRDLHLDIINYDAHRISQCYEIHTSKLVHLVDALAWTYERSQNNAILEDLHFSAGEEMCPAERLRLPLYAACRRFSVDFEAFLGDLHSKYVRGKDHSPGTYILSLRDTPDILDPAHIPHGVIFVEILGLILLDHVQSFSTLLVHSDPASPTAWDITAFVDALIFLSHISRMSPSSRVKAAYVKFLINLYAQTVGPDGKEGACAVRQFRTVIIEILRKFGSIRLSDSHVSVDLEHMPMSFREYARLAIDVFRKNSGYIDPEGRHLFVTLSNIAIHKCDSWFISLYNQEDLCCLMQCLEDASRISRDSHIPDCGYYTHVPWISTLSHAAKMNAGLFSYIPLSLLRLLEESMSIGLIAEEGTKKQLEKLIELCACRETVFVEASLDKALEDQQAPSPDSREHGLAVQTNLGSRDVLPTPQSRHEVPEHEAYDSSCQTPLLGTPSSDTLTGTTPIDSPQRSTLTSSLDRPL